MHIPTQYLVTYTDEDRTEVLDSAAVVRLRQSPDYGLDTRTATRGAFTLIKTGSTARVTCEPIDPDAPRPARYAPRLSTCPGRWRPLPQMDARAAETILPRSGQRFTLRDGTLVVLRGEHLTARFAPCTGEVAHV